MEGGGHGRERGGEYGRGSLVDFGPGREDVVVLVPSWADGVVDWVSRSELDEGEGSPLEFLCLPGRTLGRGFRNNGRGGVLAQPETDPGLVVLWAGQRVVGRLDALDAVGSVLLRVVAGRVGLVFSPPERIPADELSVGLSLLHFVVKGVQSIEGDGGVLGEAFALGLMDKSVGYSQHVAVDGWHAPPRTARPEISCLGMHLWTFLRPKPQQER
jgi:hypothetical protein